MHKKKINKISIDLTEQQLAQLQPIFDLADDAYYSGKKGIVLGQAYAPDDTGTSNKGKFVVVFFPNEYAEKLVAVIKDAKLEEIK